MITGNPYFSIIIPTFNRANDLKRALHSIKIQSFEDWEIIVVDNNSIDETVEIINEFPLNKKISYFLIENFGVIGKSRNLGIAKAKGKYIAFLDSDDWWNENKLSTDFDCLENGADLVYSDFYMVKSSDEKKIVKVRALKDNITIDLLRNGNAICNSSVVVRKSILDKVGFINEDHEFNAWVDFDLWLRISNITNRFVHINQPLVYYWFGGGNISTSENPILTPQAIRRNYIRKTDIQPLWLYSSIGSGLFLNKKYKRSIPYLKKAFILSSGLKRIKVIIKIMLAKLFSFF